MSGKIKISKKHGLNPSISVCFWCGKEKGIVLMGEIKDDAEAPLRAVFDYEPCDECREKMQQGIVVIEATMGPDALLYKNPPIDKMGSVPTGRWFVLSRKFFEENVQNEDLKARILKAGKTLMDPVTFSQYYEQIRNLILSEDNGKN